MVARVVEPGQNGLGGLMADGEETSVEEAALAALEERAIAGTAKRRGDSLIRRGVFLRELRHGLAPATAARQAGMTTRQVYGLRKRDPAFAAQWDEAMLGVVDDVESVLVTKALRGNDKSIEMVLKAHRPEKYRERHEVQVVHDAVIEVNLIPAFQEASPDGEVIEDAEVTSEEP